MALEVGVCLATLLFLISSTSAEFARGMETILVRFPARPLCSIGLIRISTFPGRFEA